MFLGRTKTENLELAAEGDERRIALERFVEGGAQRQRETVIGSPFFEVMKPLLNLVQPRRTGPGCGRA
jgi:hypothetical protein